MTRYRKLSPRELAVLEGRKHYAVVAFPNHDRVTTYEIFRGKTPYAAANRAKESLLAAVSSRGEYEEEHGGPVSDEEWVAEMVRCGFTITAATMAEDE